MENSSNKNVVTKRKKRERKDGSSSYAVPSIPNIRGVPVEITPLLISTIKKLKKIKKNTSFYYESKNDPQEQMKDASHELLASVRHQSRRNPSIPCACLAFLLSIVTNGNEHQKEYDSVMKRSALFLSRQLLFKSKACREEFSGGVVVDRTDKRGWRSSSTTIINVKNFVESVSGAHSDPLLQKEAANLLFDLSVEFGRFYPRITVASLFLTQRKGVVPTRNLTKSSLVSATAAANGDTADEEHPFMSVSALRYARDEAMTFGEKECRRIQTLVQKANLCFEILVPRVDSGFDNELGMSTSTSTSASPTQKLSEEEGENVDDAGHDDDDENDDDDDDDSLDVDWEDGDEDIASSEYAHNHEHTSHEFRVEQTLQAIVGNSTSSGPMDYAVEIDLHINSKKARSSHDQAAINNPESSPITSFETKLDNGEEFTFEEHHQHRSIVNKSEKRNPLENVATESAKSSLRTTVYFLFHVHKPRVRRWIEGLSSADDIAIANNVAIDVTTEEGKQRRKRTLANMIDCRAVVASTLASANELGVHGTDEDVLAAGSAVVASKNRRPTENDDDAASGNDCSSSNNISSRKKTSWRRLIDSSQERRAGVKAQGDLSRTLRAPVPVTSSNARRNSRVRPKFNIKLRP